MKQLKFNVKNQIIKRIDSFQVVADSQNYLNAEFEFTEEWEKPITAIFHFFTSNYEVVLDDNNSCLVPWEVIKAPYFSVSVVCGDRITANVEKVEVERSGYIEGETPKAPSPDLYNQIINMLHPPYIGENSNWYVWDDESKSFIDTGICAKGYTPQKGVDYFTPEEIEALGIAKKADKGTTLSEYGIRDAVRVITIDKTLDETTAFDEYLTSGIYVFITTDSVLSYSRLAYILQVSTYSYGNEVYQNLTDWSGCVKTRSFFLSTDEPPYAWTNWGGIPGLSNAVKNKADKSTTLAGYGIKDAYTKTESDSKFDKKVDKTTVVTVDESIYNFEFSNLCNTDVRAKTMESISFNFSTDEYSNLYEAGLCFDSGETPTRIDYIIPEKPGIIQVINWVGVDCVNTSYVNSEGQTIPITVFEPSPNKHYEVSFLYNGTQFIGWVSGFIPTGGNVVSE